MLRLIGGFDLYFFFMAILFIIPLLNVFAFYLMQLKDGANKLPANSTSKCDTRLCGLTILFEYLARLPKSEVFSRS